MDNPPLTLQTLANVVTDLQGQLANAHAQIAAQQNNLNETQQRVNLTAQELANHNSTSNFPAVSIIPKVNKPQLYRGKGSVVSWTTHMSNYLQNVEESQALTIAVSYLAEGAHEWWIVFKETEEGRTIQGWNALKDALVGRFDTLNKEKVARDKLAKWKQLKDVASFNDDFQKIVLDIPNISTEEQIDRYTRGLKAYIWKDLCTKEYTRLSDAMKDAERTEAAHSRVNNSNEIYIKKTTGNNPKPVPMDIGNIELKKLTEEERQRCMREGLCLRCRQKGHLAKACPKGRRN